MSGSVNKAILIGHVGKDPEIRTTQDGTKIASFTMATSERWKDSSGEKRERSEWHRICVFNEHIVRVIEQFVRKGAHLYVEGQLQTRKWTAQQGQDRYTTEVVLSKFRGELTLLGSKYAGPQDGNADDGGYGGGYGQ